MDRIDVRAQGLQEIWRPPRYQRDRARRARPVTESSVADARGRPLLAELAGRAEDSLATQALGRIRELYAIEAEIRGQPRGASNAKPAPSPCSTTCRPG